MAKSKWSYKMWYRKLEVERHLDICPYCERIADWKPEYNRDWDSKYYKCDHCGRVSNRCPSCKGLTLIWPHCDNCGENIEEV